MGIPALVTETSRLYCSADCSVWRPRAADLLNNRAATRPLKSCRLPLFCASSGMVGMIEWVTTTPPGWGCETPAQTSSWIGDDQRVFNPSAAPR